MLEDDYRQRIRSSPDEQKALILEIIHRCEEQQRDSPLQLFLTGPAGCGKSFLIQSILDSIQRFSKDRALVCASTGKAAVAISGHTLHSVLKISRNYHKMLSPDKLQECQALFQNVRYLFLDEASMISASLLRQIHQRLQAITGEWEKPFGGLHIFFIGDLRQLSPVMGKVIFECMDLWQSLQLYPLTKIIRQPDPPFSALLTRLGDGRTLTRAQIQAIESRFMPTELVQQLCPQGIRLFYKNKDADAYNRLCLHSPETVEARAIDTYPDQEHWVHIQTVIQKKTCLGGLPHSIPLLRGKPYLITYNMDVEHGLVNGVQGVLDYIEWDMYYQIKRLWLTFPDLKCTRYQPFKTARQIASDAFPIDRRHHTILIPHPEKKLYFRRFQFPVMVACALTIHKAQGSTFNSVIYEYHKSHRLEMVYVALSRCIDLEHLFITNRHNNFIFYHGRIPNQRSQKIIKLRREMERLQHSKLVTIQDRFLNQMKHKLSIFSFHIQNVGQYKKDMEGDCVMKQCQFVLLAETQTLDSLDHFRCVAHQQDHRGVAIYQHRDSTVVTTPYVWEKNTENGGSDICAVQCQWGSTNFVLMVIAPGALSQERQLFLTHHLTSLTHTPVFLFGNLSLHELPSDFQVHTTPTGTVLEHIFTRHLPTLAVEPYVTYLKDHRRPLIATIP